MKMKSGIFGLIAATLLVSCSTGNEVVSNGKIQKRKYNDGYYVASGNKFKKDATATQSQNQSWSTDVTEEMAVNYENVQHTAYEPETASLNEVHESPVVLAESTDGMVSETTVTIEEQTTDQGISRPLNMQKSAPKMMFRPGRESVKMIKQVVSDNSGSAAGDAMIILLVILALIIPPLAVFIFEGATGRFWIDLILAIIGIGVGWWLFGGGLAYLCALAAVIYALLIVLSVI